MRKLPPLNWLKAFESVARNQSFSLAAKELNVTQSAVSQHIKLLEHHLKTTLFIRKANSIQLTNEARQYLPTLNHAFTSLENATDNIFGNRDNIVRLHCDIAFSTLFITPRLHDFHHHHPDIELKIHNTVWWQRSQESNTLSKLQIRYGDESWTEPSIKLYPDKIFPVMHKTYYQQHPVTVDNLHQHPLFQLTGVQYNWRLWLMTADYPFAKTHINPMIESDSSIVNYLLVQQQRGIGLLSKTLVSHALQTGEFISPFTHQISTIESYHLIGTNQALNEGEKYFIDWLLKQCDAIDQHPQ